MKVAIIGAGMAGLACAERLNSVGYSLKLLDKGRRAGGRMSTRGVSTVLGDASFDYGAQYFTVRDPSFALRVEEWRREGDVARWPSAGPDAWVGTPTMDAPVQQVASRLDVRWSATVASLSRDAGAWRLHGGGVDDELFEIALITLPAEQAMLLLKPWDAQMAALAAATPSLPCWTVMVAYAERLPVEADIHRGHGIMGWAARNSAKPGRSGPESWVIQAGPEWSQEHVEDEPKAVLSGLLSAFSERVNVTLPDPLAAAAHRWRYARSGCAGEGLLWNPDLGLGVCGDWLLGPRVECAWLSGDRLADAIIANPKRL
jgi:renalase